MSGRSRGKYWTASLLKRRGWTNGLIRELLPEPRYLPFDGRFVRAWSREDVSRAESTPQFAQGRNRRRSGGERQPRDVEAVCGALRRAWEAAELDGGTAWRLAEHYHRGILDRLPAGTKGRGVRTSQAAAWLGEFLALEQRCDSRRLPEILKHFLQAGSWLGEHPDHPLAGQVYARYPNVLRAASGQALADFTDQQPEADVERFLQAEGFPAGQLLLEGLGAVWSVWYVPKAIRTSLSLLIALNPKDEYPEARAMRRRFVLHLGAPTRARPTPDSSGSSGPGRGSIWHPCGCWPWRPRRPCWTPGWTAACPPGRRRTSGRGTPTWPPRQRNCPWSGAMTWRSSTSAR